MNELGPYARKLGSCLPLNLPGIGQNVDGSFCRVAEMLAVSVLYRCAKLVVEVLQGDKGWIGMGDGGCGRNIVGEVVIEGGAGYVEVIAVVIEGSLLCEVYIFCMSENMCAYQGGVEALDRCHLIVSSNVSSFETHRCMCPSSRSLNADAVVTYLV